MEAQSEAEDDQQRRPIWRLSVCVWVRPGHMGYTMYRLQVSGTKCYPCLRSLKLFGTHWLPFVSYWVPTPHHKSLSPDRRADVGLSHCLASPSIFASLTQNGLCAEAARKCKDGVALPERVTVYEKIRSGIWVYNGVFELIDCW